MTVPLPLDDPAISRVAQGPPIAASSRQRGVALVAKRAVDIVGAGAALLALAPLLLAVAAAVRLTSRGPVIFRQERVGRGGELFTILKFRSMVIDADPEVHRRFLEEQSFAGDDADHFKVTDDPRITSVGRVIRRLSLDELPQLLNVLRGEMSLVGPRPDVPYSLEHYRPIDFRRFEVLPGLTGLWQVSGRSELSYRQMLLLDRHYVDTWTWRGDLVLLARTIPEMFRLGRAG